MSAYLGLLPGSAEFDLNLYSCLFSAVLFAGLAKLACNQRLHGIQDKCNLLGLSVFVLTQNFVNIFQIAEGLTRSNQRFHRTG